MTFDFDYVYRYPYKGRVYIINIRVFFIKIWIVYSRCLHKPMSIRTINSTNSKYKINSFKSNSNLKSKYYVTCRQLFKNLILSRYVDTPYFTGNKTDGPKPN